jgi:tight adherence protein B
MTRESAEEAALREALLSLPGVIAALKAGAPPELAWEEWPSVEVAADGRVSWHGDHAVSSSLAATARMARTTGAPLGELLEAVTSVLRDEAEAMQRRESALAGPRASATVLSWLPLAGMAMAAFVEPGSLRLLVGSPVGWALLASAAGLWWAGRRWMRALVDRAVRAGRPR